MRDLRPYHENAALYLFHNVTKFSTEINFLDFLTYKSVISIHKYNANKTYLDGNIFLTIKWTRYKQYCLS